MTRIDQNPLQNTKTRVTVELRLLETTDIHGHILPFDYLTRRADTSAGLARTSTLIREARHQARNSLLFDTGDFLQGTPLIDVVAQTDSNWTGSHPAICAMNALGYDAVGLGNHEFNYGVEWLLKTLDAAQFPVTCANAIRNRGQTPQQDETLVPQYALLDREVTDTAGRSHALRVGVVGLLPPQIINWDHFHLEGRVTTRPIVKTARALVPMLRAKGADIVVALAHTGIGDGASHDTAENAALDLADVPGLDAILAGHSHLVFPDANHAGIEGVDIERGHLKGVPAVMAGSRGSHLGVLDMTLHKSDAGWHIASSRAEVRPVSPANGKDPTQADQALCDLLEPAHKTTLAHMEKPVGHSDRALHSYLSMVRSDPLTHLVAKAQRNALHLFVPERELARLPVLSAASAFRMGGRGGPGHFTDIPAGPLRSRHASDIYPFPNTLCAVILTGAQLRDWLERSAAYFNQIAPGRPDQTLINHDFPGHHFDMIDGLTYEIDLSAPSRYRSDGTDTKTSRARRIVNLRHQGHPIDENKEFIVATNNFRLFGGAPYTRGDAARAVFQSQLPVIDAVTRQLRAVDGRFKISPAWSFRPMPETSVLFETGPGLRAHPEDISALELIDLGGTPEGFAQFRMEL